MTLMTRKALLQNYKGIDENCDRWTSSINLFPYGLTITLHYLEQFSACRYKENISGIKVFSNKHLEEKANILIDGGGKRAGKAENKEERKKRNDTRVTSTHISINISASSSATHVRREKSIKKARRDLEKRPRYPLAQSYRLYLYILASASPSSFLSTPSYV